MADSLDAGLSDHSYEIASIKGKEGNPDDRGFNWKGLLGLGAVVAVLAFAYKSMKKDDTKEK